MKDCVRVYIIRRISKKLYQIIEHEWYFKVPPKNFDGDYQKLEQDYIEELKWSMDTDHVIHPPLDVKFTVCKAFGIDFDSECDELLDGWSINEIHESYESLCYTIAFKEPRIVVSCCVKITYETFNCSKVDWEVV